VYVELETDPERAARALCAELAPGDGAARRGCAADLAVAVRRSQRALHEDLAGLARDGVIGEIGLQLDGGGQHDNKGDEKGGEKTSLRERIVQGQLEHATGHAEALCRKYHTDDEACDAVKHRFFEEYAAAEERAVRVMLDAVILKHVPAAAAGEEAAARSPGSSVIAPVSVAADVGRAAEQLSDVFKALKTSRDATRDYHLKRRDAHLLKERRSRAEMGKLRRRVAQLEAELLQATRPGPTRRGTEAPAPAPALRLVPMRRIRAADMTYAEYLRMASRSEPFILATGPPLLSTITGHARSSIVPGVPRWSHARLREACAERSFTLKITEDDPGKARSLWARLKKVGEFAMDTFLDVLETEEAEAEHTGPMSFPATRPRGSLDLREAYLHDAPLNTSCPKLLDDLLVHPFFARDLMQRTPPDIHYSWNAYRDFWPSVFVGYGGRTNSALHADWCDTAAWMGLYQGRKHWRIVPPDDRHLLYEAEPNKFPTDVFDPDFETYPTVALAKVYDGVMQPGDIIFIPAASAHQVRNLPGDPTVAVAMNFVDIANVERFVKTARELSTSAGETVFGWLKNVVGAFERMDLRYERAMLQEALQGGYVVEPPPVTYAEFKAGKKAWDAAAASFAL
jgi:hypothetical protein